MYMKKPPDSKSLSAMFKLLVQPDGRNLSAFITPSAGMRCVMEDISHAGDLRPEHGLCSKSKYREHHGMPRTACSVVAFLRHRLDGLEEEL
jgi:hypothetical protein